MYSTQNHPKFPQKKSAHRSAPHPFGIANAKPVFGEKVNGNWSANDDPQSAQLLRRRRKMGFPICAGTGLPLPLSRQLLQRSGSSGLAESTASQPCDGREAPARAISQEGRPGNNRLVEASTRDS